MPHSEIQAVLFHVNAWTTAKARSYLKKKGLKPIKRVHKTAKYLRYRITDPKIYNHLRIKRGDKKIDYIIGFKKAIIKKIIKYLKKKIAKRKLKKKWA